MKLFALLAVLLAPGFAIGETGLADSLEKCIKMPSEESCVESSNGRICTRKQSSGRVECFEALGFQRTECQYGEFGLNCVGKSAPKRFAGVSGCGSLWGEVRGGELILKLGPGDGLKSPEPCVVNGILSGKNGVYLFDVRKVGKQWVSSAPKFPVSLQAMLDSKNTQVVDLFEPQTPPWGPGVGACADSFFYRDETPGTKGYEQKAKQLARAGFDPKKVDFYARHFVGRNGRPGAMVKNFRLTDAIKICGVEVPANTKLRIDSYDGVDCESVVDGTVRIAELPPSLFPNVKMGSGVDMLPAVTCGPKGRSQTKVYRLKEGADGKLELPKLSWDQCDCTQALDSSAVGPIPE